MKVDGPDRRAMESHPRHPAQRSRSSRSTRAALERATHRLQRHLVDLAHGRPVAGLARALRQTSNRSSPLPELGAFGGHGKSALGHRAGSPGARWFGSARMFHRRHVCAGEKRGLHVGPTKRGKGTKIMGVADGHGLPLAVCTASASPAEVKLVRQTMEERFVAEVPERLIGDKAYDSDKLDSEMMTEFATEVIAPHRQGRRPERRTQDGRSLRRFRRRWKVERMFSWLYNFRRLVVRWEYHAENFLGFVHLGCALILLR